MTYRLEETLSLIVEYALLQPTDHFMIDELLAVAGIPRGPAIRNIKSCVQMGWIKLDEDRLQFSITPEGIKKAETYQNLINHSAIKPKEPKKNRFEEFYGV